MRNSAHRESSHNRSRRSFVAWSKQENKAPFFSRSNSAAAPGMRVSQVGDREEVEADKSADRVVKRLSTPFFQPAPDIREKTAGAGRATDDQTSEREGEQQADDTQRLATALKSPESEDKVTAKTDTDKANSEIAPTTVGESAEESIVLPKDENMADAQRKSEDDAGKEDDSRLVSLQPESGTETVIERVEESSVDEEPDKAHRQEQKQQNQPVKAVVASSREPLEDETVQTKASGPSLLNAEVQYRLQQSKGRGKPLPLAVQAKFGAAFGGRDFSGIRVHTGAEATSLSLDLNAKAFATGQDVYFNEGGYNPDSREGQHLLAHELTHTVQSGKAPLVAADIHGSWMEELQQQLKQSNKEAVEAEDPGPATESRKQAEQDYEAHLVGNFCVIRSCRWIGFGA